MINLDAIRAARILLVDDSADNINLLSEILAVRGYTHVSSIGDSSQVCKLHAQNDYDLILLDMHMPRMNGLDVMAQLKEVEKHAFLPVLAITGDERYKVAALEAGARDFIIKPYNLAELDLRMRNAIELRLLYKTMAAQSRLLEEKALHDSLTGLPNRRLLSDRIEIAMQYARRHQQMVALLYMDLDGFKQVNDHYGHACGDDLLKEIAERLRSVARQEDTVARIGGDEFIMVLSEISRVEDIVRPATKILSLLEVPLDIGGKSVKVTGSIGISFYPTDAEDAQTLLLRADEALYCAKHAGKNRYQFAGFPAFGDARTHSASNISFQ
ncbi:diguanylate cyclase [Janthinobacterium sp. 17J80-10]|uniref:diguanylate cyclase domain-containing protein n=1 Tax=Janthinobacterium sp. 17J80-10 TaxID=2497863 RepID=UPI0013E8E6C8|nr:diguanylate cyclase [Janthinobacterium sp. 17J80-10]